MGQSRRRNTRSLGNAEMRRAPVRIAPWDIARIDGCGGALPPFPTPTGPPIPYPIFRMTQFMSRERVQLLRSERRMLKGREPQCRAKADNIVENRKGYFAGVDPLRSSHGA